MAKTPDPYSRVYWTVLDDARFDGIRDNMAHLGTWLLLLLVADMAHPAPAFLPPAPRKSVAALRDVGLIELMGGGRYRVHGLAAERDRRSSVGIAGASARWSDGNANAMRTQTERNAIPMLDETRQAKTRRDKQANGPPTPRQQVLAWLSEHGASAPIGWVIGTLNEMVKVYGSGAVIRVWASAPSDVRTSKQYVQYAERNLSPGVHAKPPKGLGPTEQEANDAFSG